MLLIMIDLYEALLLVALVVLWLNTRLLVRWVRVQFPGHPSIFEIYFSGLYTGRQAVLAMCCTVATNCEQINAVQLTPVVWYLGCRLGVR